jgi:hypothetical protein
VRERKKVSGTVLLKNKDVKCEGPLKRFLTPYVRGIEVGRKWLIWNRNVKAGLTGRVEEMTNTRNSTVKNQGPPAGKVITGGLVIKRKRKGVRNRFANRQ